MKYLIHTLIFSVLIMLTLACSKANQTSSIAPDAFEAMDKTGITLLDVRTPDEFDAGYIPGAINIPVSELSERYTSLAENKDKEVVVYCRSGRRAANAIELLESKGFTNVVHLEGDYGQWEKDQREIVKP